MDSNQVTQDLNDCSFKIQVYESYPVENGKIQVDYEEMHEWSTESTQNYAVSSSLKNTDQIQVQVVDGAKVYFKQSSELTPLNSELLKLSGAEILNAFIKKTSFASEKAKIVFSYKKQNKICQASYPIL